MPEPEPVRIVGLDLEPVRDFRTQHTRQAGAYRALDASPQFEVVSVTTPRPALPVTRLIQLAYVRRGRSRWRQRSGLSTPAFHARTLSAERILSAREGEFDVVFQVGCTFAPGRRRRRSPYTLYLDCTLLLTHRNWPPAASHGPRALRQWVSLEGDVYRRAHHIFTMSEWARASVIHDYGIEPGNVTATGAGANLIPADDALSVHDAPIALFVGREWGRKGGTCAALGVAGGGPRGARGAAVDRGDGRSASPGWRRHLAWTDRCGRVAGAVPEGIGVRAPDTLRHVPTRASRGAWLRAPVRDYDRRRHP